VGFIQFLTMDTAGVRSMAAIHSMHNWQLYQMTA
jgi:hypothetical protein